MQFNPFPRSIREGGELDAADYAKLDTYRRALQSLFSDNGQYFYLLNL